MSMKLGPVEKQGGDRFGLNAIWDEVARLPHLTRSGFVNHQFWLALKAIFRSPVTSGLTLLTIAITLSLFSSVVLIFENSAQLINKRGGELVINIFLKDSAAKEAVTTLEEELRQREDVREVNYHSKAEALEQFKKDLGDQTLTAGLESENPLPASLEIKLRSQDRELFKALAEAYKDRPGVEQIIYNEGLLEQFGELLRSGRKVGLSVALLVLLMSAFIIGSTIKLALYSHRDEIEIMQLVGATDNFVSAPYLIEGALEGFLGSLISLGVVSILFYAVSGFLNTSAFLGIFSAELRFLSPQVQIGICLLGVLVGLSGSYLTLRRFRLE